MRRRCCCGALLPCSNDFLWPDECSLDINYGETPCTSDGDVCAKATGFYILSRLGAAASPNATYRVNLTGVTCFSSSVGSVEFNWIDVGFSCTGGGSMDVSVVTRFTTGFGTFSLSGWSDTFTPPAFSGTLSYLYPGTPFPHAQWRCNGLGPGFVIPGDAIYTLL